jgi:hypothetical protein
MATDNGPKRDVSPEGSVPNPKRPQPQPTTGKV